MDTQETTSERTGPASDGAAPVGTSSSAEFRRWSPRRRAVAWVFRAISWVLAGRNVRFLAPLEGDRQRIYFSNHASHIDFLLVWSALPARLRRQTRPVAGRDYWCRSSLKRYLSQDVFGAVLIERPRRDGTALRNGAGLRPVLDALAGGDSLVFFPEGTRNTKGGVAPFKSGLYHLAKAHPDVELVPIRIGGSHKVLAKGQKVPVPRNPWLTFGPALQLREGESKDEFLARARAAILELPEGR